MTDSARKKYSDEEIEEKIRWLKDEVLPITAAMLKQLMDGKDEARKTIVQYEKKRVELVTLIKRAVAFLDSDNTKQWSVIYDCEKSIPGFCFGQTDQK